MEHDEHYIIEGKFGIHEAFYDENKRGFHAENGDFIDEVEVTDKLRTFEEFDIHLAPPPVEIIKRIANK